MLQKRLGLHRTYSMMAKPIKSVAVVGGGPTGVGFAKALVQENHFKNITLYERRSRFGGLWNYTKDESNNPSLLNVPSENPFLSPSETDRSTVSPYETPIRTPLSKNCNTGYLWPSAVYEELDTNIPKDLMAYNKYPFDAALPLFPKHRDVLEYLRNYSKDVESLVRFDTKVVDVQFINGDNGNPFIEDVKAGKIKHLDDINHEAYSWKVTSRPIVDATKGGTIADTTPNSPYADKIEYYDAVAVASGNYDIPYIPKFPGLQEWHTSFPNSVLHAKYYDNYHQFTKDDIILIVGNSASGADIAYQLATLLEIPIYKSKRSENLQPAGSDPLIKELANIKRFIPEKQEVEFVDGEVLKGVTKVIFATGYLKSYPYLNSLSVPFLDSFESTPDSIAKNKIQPIISSGFKINGFYRHLLSYQYPGLTVIGTPKYVLPTRLSETQGAWIARVWSGRIKLPDQAKLKQWELDRLNEVEGNDYRFHSIPFPQDVDYYNLLNNEILDSGADSGLIPVLWDKRQTLIRKHVKKIKEAHIKYKADRNRPAYSLEELEESGYLNLNDDN